MWILNKQIKHKFWFTLQYIQNLYFSLYFISVIKVLRNHSRDLFPEFCWYFYWSCRELHTLFSKNDIILLGISLTLTLRNVAACKQHTLSYYRSWFKATDCIMILRFWQICIQKRSDSLYQDMSSWMLYLWID